MKLTRLLLAAIVMVAPVSLALAKDEALAKAIAGSHRTPSMVERDKARKPQEVLEFIGIKPTMTVVEISPGAGYWTEILGPYLKGKGTYYVVGSSRSIEGIRKKQEANPALYSEVKPIEAAPAGSADLVLTFRNVHNWMSNGTADQQFSAFFTALKPGGVLGVEEHRASNAQPQDPKAANGYVREDYTIQLAEKAGFKLLGKSEILANPKDTKDYPQGVWTLPPTLALGDKDREKYIAIGESDNYLLKFEKPKK